MFLSVQITFLILAAVCFPFIRNPPEVDFKAQEPQELEMRCDPADDETSLEPISLAVSREPSYPSEVVKTKSPSPSVVLIRGTLAYCEMPLHSLHSEVVYTVSMTGDSQLCFTDLMFELTRRKLVLVGLLDYDKGSDKQQVKDYLNSCF